MVNSKVFSKWDLILTHLATIWEQMVSVRSSFEITADFFFVKFLYPSNPEISTCSAGRSKLEL